MRTEETEKQVLLGNRRGEKNVEEREKEIRSSLLVSNLYGLPSDRIRLASSPSNSLKSLTDLARKQYQLVRAREISSSFVQSRRFQPEQFVRDNHDLGHPSALHAPLSISAPRYGGIGSQLAASSQEGCRLTNNFCAHDYQCCSGKCRCVRWSVMGKMSCWKKCYWIENKFLERKHGMPRGLAFYSIDQPRRKEK